MRIVKKSEKELSESLMNREELLIQEKQHYEALACEETVLKEESSSLAESDAAKLKDQEIKLTQDLDEKRKEERKKRGSGTGEKRKTSGCKGKAQTGK